VTTDMATRNVEALRGFLDAIEGGDRDQLRALLADFVHPDCTWSPLVGRVEGGGYEGPGGMVSFFDDLLGSFEVRYEDRELRPIGDRSVLLLCRMELRGRHSGVAVSQELGATHEFEDGRLRRGRAYASHAEGLAAAEALGA
jgi:ketosteroid isomerase-like protein